MSDALATTMHYYTVRGDYATDENLESCICRVRSCCRLRLLNLSYVIFVNLFYFSYGNRGCLLVISYDDSYCFLSHRRLVFGCALSRVAAAQEMAYRLGYVWVAGCLSSLVFGFVNRSQLSSLNGDLVLFILPLGDPDFALSLRVPSPLVLDLVQANLSSWASQLFQIPCLTSLVSSN